MSGTSSISGIISGLKTDEIITKLMALEKQPMDKVQAKQDAAQEKFDAWTSIMAKLTNVRIQSLTLSRSYTFKTMSATSSNTAALSITSTAGATAGTQKITIDQLAQAEQVLSRGVASTTSALMAGGKIQVKLGQGAITGNSVSTYTELSALNSGAGVDTANGITITNRAGTSANITFTNAQTVQDVIDNINNVSANASLNIVASLNADGNGLLLTDSSGGTLQDLQVAEYGGTTAQDLGLLAASSGKTLSGADLDPTYTISIDSTNNTLEGIRDTINDLNAPFTASIMNTGSTTNPYKLVINSTYSGTIGDLTITDVADKITNEAVGTGDGTRGSALGDYALDFAPIYNISNIESITVGGIAYTVSAAGGHGNGANEVEVDLSTGKLQFFSNGSATNVTGEIRATYTPANLDLDLAQGQGKVTQIAQDAQLKVGTDNPQIVTRHTNVIDDLITGVSFEIKEETTAPVTLTVQTDLTDIKKTINDFIDSYNAAMSAIKAQFSYDSETAKTGGPLFGDQTLMLIQNQLQDGILSDVAGLPSSMRSIFQIGVTSDLEGKLSVDDEALTEALTYNLDAVIKLFTSSTNVATSSTATASSSTGTATGYSADSVISGTGTSETFGEGTGGWMSSDAVSESNPSYFTVKYSAAQAVAKILINTLDSSTSSAAEWGIKNLKIQYLKLGGDAALDADWIDSSTISGNQSGTITDYLPSTYTEQIRLKITGSNAADNKARLVSIQTYEDTGLAGRLNNVLSTITDAYTGTIAYAQQGIKDSIDTYQDRIDEMQLSLDAKEDNLYKQYAALETYMSKWKTLGESLQTSIDGLSGNSSSSSS